MTFGRVGAGLGVLIGCLALAACRDFLSPDYEYEEQLYLTVDGEASVVVNASVAALVALRGAALDPSATTIDRDEVRRTFEAAGCSVESVSRGWRRSGRLFVQIQLQTEDVRTLSACGLTSWSTYALAPVGEDRLKFQQTVAPPPETAAAARARVWSGDELVAFRLHAPSRVHFHNVKRLDGENGTLERGNILTWQQRLSDRLSGVPVDMQVEMGQASILNTAIVLFVGAFAAAVLVLATLVWLAKRRGRRG